ncbi:MAG: hypothetical protein U0264_04220 [Candidatus Kapaibacterium sp.]
MRHFKHIVPIIILLTAQNLAFGQIDSARIYLLVNRLSWKSISMNCMGTIIMLTHEDSTEKAILKIGKPATNKLIEALDDTSKTVIAHIVLTQIWNDNKNRLLSEKYIFKECNQRVGTHYVYNGLVWEWYDGKDFGIRQSEVEKIKKYWIAKLIDKKSVAIDKTKLLLDLEKLDNETYPCD